MTCPAWQRLLDEHPQGNPAEAFEQHGQACPCCSAQAPEQRHLLRALPHLVPPEPPAGLAEAITAATLASRSRVPKRWASLAALAAAALVLLAIGLQLRRPSRPGHPPVALPAPTLREAASQAGEAGTRLISRTRSGTVDQAVRLLPPFGPLSVEAAPAPALVPLQETAVEVSTGLGPVTASARRAVNLFFRDMPFGNNPG